MLVPFAGGFNHEKAISANHYTLPDPNLPEDEFWEEIRKLYWLKPDYINLENGYYCFLPQPTLQAYIENVKHVNEQGSFYFRTQMDADRQGARQLLADFVRCPVEEVILTRNTTESMAIVIQGFDWKPGDEAVMAYQDYGTMLEMFAQQAKRYGIVNKWVDIPNHPQSDEEIVALYEQAITPKTKLLMVCHIINITGQILPVRKICEMAHRYGVKVVVDGAHAVAHFDFDLKELQCDFYACSLHKWLSVPLGAGLLYVQRDNIPLLWPLMPLGGFADDDIRKLAHRGTYPVHVDMTLAKAVDFHQYLGTARKEARLRYLQQYWTSQVRNIEAIVLNTPDQPERACAIANVHIPKFKPAELQKLLLEQYHIWTVAIDRKGVQGCRITPQVYTTLAELDRFVEALIELSQ